MQYAVETCRSNKNVLSWDDFELFLNTLYSSAFVGE